jgi:Uma2 family endonuclease
MTLANFQKITIEDFLQLPDIEESPAWEYIDGDVIQKSMGGGKHSILQKRLVAAIDQAGNQYEAFPELRCTFGNRSIVSDIAIVSINQLPLDENGEIISTGIDFAPNCVTEILSPDQSQTKVTGKILHALRHGSSLGWLLDPKERSILVFKPDRLPDVLSGESMLPVTEGISLKLSVDQIFSWLRRT